MLQVVFGREMFQSELHAETHEDSSREWENLGHRTDFFTILLETTIHRAVLLGKPAGRLQKTSLRVPT